MSATRQQRRTSPGLLPEARHLVLPDGIVSSGFPAVQATCAQLGLSFDPWQVDLNRCILAKDASGEYAADTVVMSIPRQVGKTWNVGALVFADCIIKPKTTTVWTAHQFKVARETFNELRAWANSPALAPHIDPDAITTAAGNEMIPFRNGSRIVFAARERGAIRGFTKVRRLVLDEAQILTERALADLAPTMNQAENPQTILMGTPPRPVDPGEVFLRLRKEALSGEADGVMYVELSAPVGSRTDDREAWRVANPSYPSRTPPKAMERLRRLLSEEDFTREALGVWDDDGGYDVFGAGRWSAAATDAAPAVPVGALGVAVTLDGSSAAVGAAARDGDVVHVKPLQHGPGVAWVVEAAQSFQARHGVDVVIDEGGPAAVLIPDLERAGVRLLRLKTADVLNACASLFDLVQESRLRHGSFPELDAAVKGAKKRDVGDRGWAWGRKKSTSDISPLEAVTLAAWGARQEPTRSAYEDRDLMMV